jgi:hypothetical protein
LVVRNAPYALISIKDLFYLIVPRRERLARREETERNVRPDLCLRDRRKTTPHRQKKKETSFAELHRDFFLVPIIAASPRKDYDETLHGTVTLARIVPGKFDSQTPK